VHGPKSRKKHTDYALGLMEKQKLRYFYGLMERQFRNVYEKAVRRRGVTGEIMLQMLETRLDNVVFHLGFGTTRAAARQMVNHGHVKVNGRKVSAPSATVKVGDEITVRDKGVSKQMAIKSLESSTSRVVPEWMSVNKTDLKGVIMRLPTMAEMQPIGNVQTVVEFYSR